MCFFFFSSRRRHTRCSRDWSSDVCSSDLKTQPEIFLEPVGTHGFAPTDVVVAPDGSLFISIGGRKTRGAVYHVEYVGDGKQLSAREPTEELPQVLDAPQPLDAWSRARWMPLAKKLGADAFARAVTDATFSDKERVRAIEVLTEMFGGLPDKVARAAAADASAAMR